MALGFSSQISAIRPPGMRRKFGNSYLDEIRGQYGLATSSVISERAKKQQEQLRSEDVAFREKELQSNISFQNQQIAAQNRQLQQQQQIAEQQAKQAQQSNMLSTTSLGIATYPHLKSGFKALTGIFDTAAPSVSTTVATEPLFGGVSTGVGTSAAEYVTAESAMAGSSAANTGTSTAAGGSSGLGMAGGIAAIALAQHGLANATNTVFEGQKTGDFFSRDDQGRWAPRFGNDPWHGWANDQWGFGPSAGEKWDAAMYNKDWGTLAKRTPAAAAQWLDPVGDFAYDATTGILRNWGVDDDTANALVAPLNPIAAASDRIGEIEDIGGAAEFLLDPIGISDAWGGITDWIGGWF